MSRVPSIDKAVQKIYEWLDEINSELRWGDRQLAFTALRATLQALRDRLTVDEAAQLAAQLPLLVRGLYYEGWDPSSTPVRVRRKEEFLASIAAALSWESSALPEEAARAVLAVVSRHLAAGEIDDVVRSLPAPLRDLFPAAAAAGGA